MIFSYKGEKRKVKDWVITLLYFIILIAFTIIIVKVRPVEPVEDYPYSYENWTEYVDSLEK